MRSPHLVIVIISLLGSVSALADKADVEGSPGLGADATLAGLGGVSARYQLTQRFGAQTVFALARRSGTDAMMQSFSDQGLFAALRGDARLLHFEDVHLDAIMGLDLFRVARESGGTTSSDTRVALEGGAKVEYHATTYFSVHLEVGLVLGLFSGFEEASVLGVGSVGAAHPPFQGDSVGAMEGSAFTVGIGETLASMGFTFWLR
jgi:hypothetical protein